MSPKPYEPSAVALEGDSACRLLGAELLIGTGERGALVWQIRFKWVDCLTETFSVLFCLCSVLIARLSCSQMDVACLGMAFFLVAL